MPRQEHVAHGRLKNLLENTFTAPQLDAFKNRARAHGLRPGELSRMLTFVNVFDALERKGVFGPGNYHELKEMLRDIDMVDYVEDVKEAEREQGIAEESDHSVATAQPPVVYAVPKPSSASVAPIKPPPQLNTATVLPQKPEPPAAAGASAGATPVKGNITDEDDAGKSDESLSWRVEYSYRRGPGLVIIIRNYTAERCGSNIDETNIKEIFERMGYTVMKPYHDLTKAELLAKLDGLKAFISMIKDTGKEFNSLVIFISSHGQKEGIKSQDNQIVSIEEITSRFNGESLSEMVGKPKVFLIQACRGQSYGRGVSIDRPDDEPGDSAPLSPPPIDDVSPELGLKTIPVNADMLLAHATTEGTRAWRNEEDGSWFINHLCKVIREKKDKFHLIEILTLVNGQVAARFASERNAKQMPEQITTLTKLFYL